MKDPALRKAVYNTQLDDRGWVEALGVELMRAMDLPMGVFVCLRHREEPSSADRHFERDLPFDSKNLQRLIRPLIPTLQQELGSHPWVCTHQQESSDPQADELGRLLGEGAARDLLILSAGTEERRFVVAAPFPSVIEIHEERLLQWHRLAVHFGVALRLRVMHSTEADSTANTSQLWRDLLDGNVQLVESFTADDRCVLVLQRTAPGQAGRRALSNRERQVVTLAARGMANKAIGYELDLSTSTVGSHLKSGLDKLGIASRVELARHATRLLVADDAPAGLADEISELKLTELDSALQMCRRELRRLTRMTPVHGTTALAREAKVEELRRIVRAFERLLEDAD